MTTDQQPTEELSFEREKWLKEVEFKERELSLSEKVQEADREARLDEQRASRWKNPVVVAIFAAAVAGAGNAFLSYLSAESQVRLETLKSEQIRILEMIKTGDPEKAALNLRFLLQAGLIREPTLRTDLEKYLRDLKPGAAPSLPIASLLGSAEQTRKFMSRFEASYLLPHLDNSGISIIGFSHVLTKEELDSGVINIQGKEIAYKGGLTEDQVQQLFEQDLTLTRKQIDELVRVPLTSAQKEALVSFCSGQVFSDTEIGSFSAVCCS